MEEEYVGDVKHEKSPLRQMARLAQLLVVVYVLEQTWVTLMLPFQQSKNLNHINFAAALYMPHLIAEIEQLSIYLLHFEKHHNYSMCIECVSSFWPFSFIVASLSISSFPKPTGTIVIKDQQYGYKISKVSYCDSFSSCVLFPKQISGNYESLEAAFNWWWRFFHTALDGGVMCF